MYMTLLKKSNKKILYYISTVPCPYREREKNFVEEKIDPCGQIVGFFFSQNDSFFPRFVLYRLSGCHCSIRHRCHASLTYHINNIICEQNKIIKCLTGFRIYTLMAFSTTDYLIKHTSIVPTRWIGTRGFSHCLHL